MSLESQEEELLTWLDLPENVQFHICSYFGIAELCAFQSTCQQGRELARSDRSWHRVFDIEKRRREFWRRRLHDPSESWYQTVRRMYSLSSSDLFCLAYGLDLAKAIQRLDEYRKLKPVFLQLLSTPPNASQKEALRTIRQHLSMERDPPIDLVIAYHHGELVDRLVEFLQIENAETVFEATWCLTNIGSGNHDQSAFVVERGLLDAVIPLLRHTVMDIVVQAAWCLGNIAGDGPALRDLVLAHPAAVDTLLALLNGDALQAVRQASWTVSNLCRGKPLPRWESVSQFIPGLTHVILNCGADDARGDSLWALSYLSDGYSENIDVVNDATLLRRIVELMSQPSTSGQVPALRTIGNICTGSDEQTNRVIIAGAVPILGSLLSSPRRGLRKEAAWALSNIAAGSQQQIRHLIEAGIFQTLINQWYKEDTFDTQKEMAWVLSNALNGGGSENLPTLLSLGVIAPLLSVCAPGKDRRLTQVALEGLAAGLMWCIKSGSNEITERLVEELIGANLLSHLSVLMEDNGPDSLAAKAADLMERLSAFDPTGLRRAEALQGRVKCEDCQGYLPAAGPHNCSQGKGKVGGGGEDQNSPTQANAGENSETEASIMMEDEDMEVSSLRQMLLDMGFAPDRIHSVVRISTDLNTCVTLLLQEEW